MKNKKEAKEYKLHVKFSDGNVNMINDLKERTGFILT